MENKKKTEAPISSAKTDSENEILELRDITKTFLGGKVIANDNVSISFKRNEVHALVGENGSGKSTLMNILFGLYKQDSGKIILNGKTVDMYQPGAAKHFRIGMVHQHFHLVDEFTVLENVILGQEKLTESKSRTELVNSIREEVKSINEKLEKIAIKDSKIIEKIEKVYEDRLALVKRERKLNNKIELGKNRKSKVNAETKKELFDELTEKINLRIKQKEETKKEIAKIDKFLSSTNNKTEQKVIQLTERREFLRREFRIHNANLTGRFGKINKDKALKRLKLIEEKYNIKLDPFAKIKTLAVGQRQMVEILKVLWEDKELIVFDEPTATLSVVEIEELLKTMKALKEEGKTIIFISHKLKEVKEISDRVSVLRKGNMMGTFVNDDKLKPADIGNKMVGRTINLEYPARNIKGDDILTVEGLSYRAKSGFKALDNVSFSVKEGEIFGIAGIEGNGQEEIIKILTNLRKPYKGTVKFKGELLTDKKGYKLSGKERRAIMSHSPIDRLKHGVVPQKSLEFNSKVSDYDGDFFKNIKPSEFTSKIIKEMNVDGAFTNHVELRNLSGGNQQKFVVGRELYRNHEIFIAGHPTRGLDISAIDNIYKQMINNSKGKATILYSLEISELMAVCDRVAILYHGKVMDIIDPNKTSMDKVSRLMIGEVK